MLIVTLEQLRRNGRKRRMFLLALCAWVGYVSYRLRSAASEQVFPHRGKRYLIVNPISGLGNRLRATCSAAVLAERMRRELIIVWLPDVHLDANMSDLFDTSGLSVLNQDIYEQLSPDNTISYDFDTLPQVPIRGHYASYIYVKSAFRLNGEGKKLHVTEAAFKRCIRKLRPNRVVEELHGRLRSATQLRAKTVGVHVRMLGELELDVPDLNRVPAEKQHIEPGIQNIVRYERAKCNASFFKKPMKRLSLHEDVHFFVSLDSLEAWSTLNRMSNEFSISLLNEASFAMCNTGMRRSAFCAQHALAEMLTLSDMDYFLYSSWSSFSEIISAMRVGDKQSSILGCATDDVMMADMFAQVMKKPLV